MNEEWNKPTPPLRSWAHIAAVGFLCFMGVVAITMWIVWG